MLRVARRSAKDCERLFLRRARMAATRDCAARVDRRFGQTLPVNLISTAGEHWFPCALPMITPHRVGELPLPDESRSDFGGGTLLSTCTLVSGILGHFFVFQISAKNQCLDSNHPLGLQSFPMERPPSGLLTAGRVTLPNTPRTLTA